MKEMILKTGKFQFLIGTILQKSVLSVSFILGSNLFQFLIGTVLPVEQTKGGKNNEAVCFNSL